MESTPYPLVLFDGICNLCNGFVQLVIRHDPRGLIHFASLQSAYGKRITRQYGLEDTSLRSVIYIDHGQVYRESEAALKILGQLAPPLKYASALGIFPGFIRNGIYRFIAKNRYKIFGKRASCMIPSGGLKDRFYEE